MLVQAHVVTAHTPIHSTALVTSCVLMVPTSLSDLQELVDSSTTAIFLSVSPCMYVPWLLNFMFKKKMIIFPVLHSLEWYLQYCLAEAFSPPPSSSQHTFNNQSRLDNFSSVSRSTVPQRIFCEAGKPHPQSVLFNKVNVCHKV